MFVLRAVRGVIIGLKKLMMMSQIRQVVIGTKSTIDRIWVMQLSFEDALLIPSDIGIMKLPASLPKANIDIKKTDE